MVLRIPRRSRFSEKFLASLEDGDGELPSLPPTSVQPAPDKYFPRHRRRVRRLCDDIPSRPVTEMFMQGLVIDADWLRRGERERPPEVHDPDMDAEGDTDREDEIQTFSNDGKVVTSEDAIVDVEEGAKLGSDPVQDQLQGKASTSGPTPQQDWTVLLDVGEDGA